MKKELAAAINAFEAAYREVDSARAALDSVRDIALAAPGNLDPLGHLAESWNLHNRSLDYAKTQVQNVQALVAKLGMAFASVRKGTGFTLPPFASKTALAGLQGGTALLAGVTYSAERFADSVKNPTTDTLGGALAGINWAALGGVIGLIDQELRK